MHVKLLIIITAINCTENIVQKQNNVLSAVWRCNNRDIVWQCIVTNDKFSHIGIWKNALVYMIYSSNSWASHLPTDIVLYFRLYYAAASLALSEPIALVSNIVFPALTLYCTESDNAIRISSLTQYCRFWQRAL